MMTNRESAAIDFRTRMHRTHVRRTLVGTKSGCGKYRHQTLVNSDPRHLPALPESCRPRADVAGYYVKKCPKKGHPVYWHGLTGGGWKADTPSKLYPTESQADAIASQLCAYTEPAY